MRGLQVSGGWLEDPWDVPDPDEVQDTFKKLFVHYSDSAINACWAHILDIDAVELTNVRGHQKMALARYGRQSLLQWGDVDITELRFWYEQLKTLMEQETAKPEDQ